MKHIDEKEFIELVSLVQKIDLYKTINPINTESFFTELEKGQIIGLEYSVDLEYVTHVKEKLSGLKERINTSDELPEIVKKAYIDKVTEEIFLTKMLIAVAQKDDRTVFEMSKQVYGLPSVTTVASVMSKFESDLKNSNVDYSNLPELKRVFEWASKKGEVEVDEVFYGDDEEKGVLRNSEYIAGAFKGALKDLKINDWSVEISDEVRAISVNSKNKKNRVPHDREVSDLHLKALVNHEIKTHVKRFVAGDNTQVKLLGYGLASYEAAEEGLAMWGERMIEQGTHINSLSFLLGIAAIAGMYEEEYSIIRLHNLLKEYFSLFGRPEQVQKR